MTLLLPEELLMAMLLVVIPLEEILIRIRQIKETLAEAAAITTKASLKKKLNELRNGLEWNRTESGALSLKELERAHQQNLQA
jgi:hypothetical protein